MSYPQITEATLRRIEVIRSVYKSGMSALDLSEAVSATGDQVSRNAIIGIYSRHKDLLLRCPLGKSGVRTSKSVYPKVRKNTPLQPQKQKATRGKVVTTPAPKANEPDSSVMPIGKLLFELENRDCRWPVGGSGASTLFCSREKTDGSSYCQHHAIKAAGRGTISERRACDHLHRKAAA